MDDQYPEQEQIPEVEKEGQQQLPPTKIKQKNPWRFSKIDDHIRSWLFTALILFFSFILVRLIVQEITDDSFHIQAFRVPENLVKVGYDGVTSAYMLMDKVNHIIEIGNQTRSIKDLGAYNQSAEKTELNVEISGIGLSPEIISLYIKQALGIKSKTIGGEVIRSSEGLVMMLRMGPGPAEEIYEKIDTEGEVVAYNKLFQQAAQRILMKNNPLVLGLYFRRESWMEGKNGDAISAFRQATLQNRSEAADAYAWWAEKLYNTSDRDTSLAMPKIRKALAIDSLNKTAINIWGCMNAFPFEQRIKLLRKAVKIDPTWVTAWNDLGAALYHHDLPKYKAEAIQCFQKCQKIDSTYWKSYEHWGRLLMYNGQFEEAAEKLDKALLLKPKSLFEALYFDDAIYYGIAVLSNNQTFSTFLKQDHFTISRDNQKLENNQILGEKLNSIGYALEIHKQYTGAFKIIRQALEYDSTSKIASGSLSTMAELYGLTGDSENFYHYIEKALKVGWKPELKDICKDDPYKKFCGESRFQKLLNTHVKLK